MKPPSSSRVLVIATALAALLTPLPALAQESSAPTVCPNVAYTTSQEDLSGPADTPVTLRFYSDVQPARTPDSWTLTRVSPGPAEIVQTAPSAPSATFTISVAQTTTYRVDAVGPQGCGPASATFTRTVTSASPTPTPTPTPHSDRACPTVTVAQPATITSGQTVDIVVSVDRTSASSTVTLLRDSPAPRAVVRGVRTAEKTVTFTVRLGETHRFRASAYDGPCLGGQEAAFVAPVRALVSIAAIRSSTRDYTFTGRVQPAYGTVGLYRVEASGRRVLTSTAPVQTNGTYRIDRTFLGSGRFGFVTVAHPGSTGRYSASESAVRPTVIH